MAEPERYFTEPLIGELLLRVRTDRVRKLEFIAAMTEGVVLAIEQVQEVRIAALEAGPETSIGSLVSDAFWGFLFDSSINVLWTSLLLGKFLRSLEKVTWGLAQIEHAVHTQRTAGQRAAAGSVARERADAATKLRVLRAALNGGRLPETAVSPEVAEFLNKAAAQGSASAPMLRDAIAEAQKILDKRIETTSKPESHRGTTASLGLLSLGLRDLRIRIDESGDPERAAAAVAVEQLLAQTRNYLGSDPGSPPTGVPATDLLASIYAWASRQRQQVALIYDMAEITLGQGGHLEDLGAIGLLLASMSDSAPIDLGATRSRAWALSEAVIWAESYRKNLVDPSIVDPEDNGLSEVRIDPKISAYLTRRFAELARTWIASPSADEALVVPGNVAESQANARLRNAAATQLGRVRTLMGDVKRIQGMSKQGTKELVNEKVDSHSVRAFLLGMLFVYRGSAAALVEALNHAKEDLKQK